ncbi:SRPBCC family protein [Streptomyces gilvus]|uniref:SRPBCC family protein n=1 Tax=Streptomyces gilvus TaxID=2920937 RepID=UPI001F100C37|nr:SRPBCC family protein [Streptomyces sp. CME 23]MCH5676362.1 SRPBCC family protein [Streptomyces sp. CME 23]
MSHTGLYIEARIHADLDDLWTRTQDPAQHQRWDLRFTEITHLPREEGEPQRFRYATRIGPFLTVAGTGVSAGERERPDGTRTSALRFSSPHPLSLLAEGSGYWRYVPDGDGVRFLTGYDYRPRWGRLGTTADRLLFRPLMGWATAWSFDRLRLWLERGITPERALANWLTELLIRALVITTACTALAPAASLPLFGPFTASLAYLCPLLLTVAVCVALFKAPLPCTPAARRCLRTPPTRIRAPRVLRTLENPR